MNRIPINRLVDMSGVSNVFYGTKFTSNSSGNKGELSLSYQNIADKCNNFDYSNDGIISTNDPNYDYYKKSQFYQENNPSNKLNAFLWYYATGQLDESTKLNSSEKINSKPVTQMKNMACQILQDKAVSIDISQVNENTCSGSNIFKCSIPNIFSKSLTSNKPILIFIFFTTTVLFIFGTISLMKTMFRFFKEFNITENGIGWIIWNIFGIIIGFIIGSLVLIYAYTTAGQGSSDTASENEYVFIPGNVIGKTNIESFGNSNTCKNGDTPVWGCCDDGETHKVDPLGSNCCKAESVIPGGNVGGCSSTEFGCCPNSNIAKVDANGSNCTSVTPGEQEEEGLIGGCSGTQFGCCPGTNIAKEDSEGSNCPGCSNTLYGGCDYPNNSTAKIDSAGSNCESSSGGFSTTIIWFIVLIILSVIFFILFCTFNKDSYKVLSRLLFAGFIICTLLSLNLLFGIIKTDDNTGLILKKQINTNLDVFSGFNNISEGKLFGPSLLLFSGLLILSLFLNSKDEIIFNILKPVSWSMLGLSLVVLFFSIFYLYWQYPAIFGSSILILRFVWNMILTLLMKVQSNKGFVLNLNALLYEYPLQYFVNLANTPTTNLFTGTQVNQSPTKKVALPTGLPWDLPGVKLLKTLLLLIAKIPNIEVPNLLINDIDKSVTYPSSNINVFSWIPYIKSLI